MKTTIQTLAANFFAPTHVTPQERQFNPGSKESGKVLDVSPLNYPDYYAISIGRGRCWSSTSYEVMTDLRISKGQVLKPGDVIGLTRGSLTHHFDAVRAHTFASDGERAELLLEIVKQWAGKPVTCFCNGEGPLSDFDYQKWQETDEENRRECPLGWKQPSTCYSCRVTTTMLSVVLGKQAAPFIIPQGDRRYRLNIPKLIACVSDGRQIATESWEV